jgi:hypothetical protein
LYEAPKLDELALRKRIFNLGVRILNILIPESSASYPQSIMIVNVSEKLNKAFKTEVYCGLFDGAPHQTLTLLKDRNFQRFLNLSRKLLVYFSENDRYYRSWLGLFMLLVSDEVDAELAKLSFEDFLTLVKLQWETNMKGAVPREYFNEHKKDLLNMVLANYLMNIS